jgi:hypothetical protein
MGRRRSIHMTVHEMISKRGLVKGNPAAAGRIGTSICHKVPGIQGLIKGRILHSLVRFRQVAGIREIFAIVVIFKTAF